MDEADFRHWSRMGVITGGPDMIPQPNGASVIYAVLEDDRPNTIPVPVEKLVKLAPPAAGGPSEWSAQCFPTNGDRPGLPMFFRNVDDLLIFIRQFSAAGLTDEKLRVRASPSATEDEKRRVRSAGVEVV